MTNSELRVTLDRIEGDFAVLTYGEGELLWPRKQLSDHIHEGDELVLSAKKDADATKDRTELAKAMLNELLKKDEDR